MKNLNPKITIFLLVLSIVSLGATAQQVRPEQLIGGKVSEIPIAVQVLRWHMHDDNVNAMTFRSMDTLFTTRTVSPSGTAWDLPKDSHELDFTYSWQGEN